MAKAAAARLRGLGMLNVATDWERKAAVCERCPLRVVKCGVSYCGNPYLQQIDRDPAIDGCGCPCREKAKTPGEHCPIDRTYRPAALKEPCTCRWCDGKSEPFRLGTSRR